MTIQDICERLDLVLFKQQREIMADLEHELRSQGDTTRADAILGVLNFLEDVAMEVEDVAMEVEGDYIPDCEGCRDRGCDGCME